MQRDIMKFRFSTASISLLLLIAVSSIGFAQIPRTMSYQGIANDQTGNPLSDGSHNVTFSIYTTASGGSPVYSETQSVITRNGLFSARIGASIPLPTSIGFDRQYWLGIAIDGGAEFAPRTSLTSAPYALNATHATNADHALRADSADALSAGAIGFVRSLNSRTGHVRLVEGLGIHLETLGDSIRISADVAGGGGSINAISNSDSALEIINRAGPVPTINVAEKGIKGSMIDDYAISLANLDTAGASAGQAIVFDGTSFMFGNIGGEGFTLPFIETVDTTTAFSILNTGGGSAGGGV